MADPALHVRIISPQELIFDSQALSVSSKNLSGAFDILPQHANFITMIEDTPIIIRVSNQKPIVYKFPMSIIHVTNNTVSIYTYIQPSLEKK